MLTLQNILNLFSDKEIYDSLIHIMENYFQDFCEVQKKYLQAMDTLEKDLGEASITKEKEAIQKRIASTLFFSGWLGLQANLNYYLDPRAGNFLNTEPELYLQEKASRKLIIEELSSGNIISLFGTSMISYIQHRSLVILPASPLIIFGVK